IQNFSYGPFSLGATGGLGEGTYVWSVVQGSLPVGVTLSKGVISGTPTALGVSNFGLQVSSGGVSAATACTVTIAPAPLVLDGIAAPGQIGVPYSARITASGGIPPYSYSATGLPPGLGFANGLIAGTPDSAGDYNITVNVTD